MLSLVCVCGCAGDSVPGRNLSELCLTLGDMPGWQEEASAYAPSLFLREVEYKLGLDNGTVSGIYTIKFRKEYDENTEATVECNIYESSERAKQLFDGFRSNIPEDMLFDVDVGEEGFLRKDVSPQGISGASVSFMKSRFFVAVGMSRPAKPGSGSQDGVLNATDIDELTRYARIVEDRI